MTATCRLLTFCLLPFAFCLPATAGPDDRDLDADILILLAPHAGPNLKIEAAQRIGDRGPAAARAAPALVHQTRYNLEPVRDKALQSLVRVAGPAEAQRLLATDRLRQEMANALNDQWITAALDEIVYGRPAGNPRAAALKESLNTVEAWRDVASIEMLLESDVGGSAQFALGALEKLAQSDPQGGRNLGGYYREKLVAGLERLAQDDPPIRARILPLIELFGPARAPAVRFLLRCSRDPKIVENTDQRYQVQRLLIDALDRAPRAPSALQGLADILVDRDPKLAAAAAARVTPALAADPDFKPAVATAVANQVAAGNADAMALLKRYDVSADTFAHRAFNLIAAAPAARQPHLRLLRAVRPGAAQSTLEARPDLRALLIGYLLTPGDDAHRRNSPVIDRDDEDLAAAAASLLTGPLARRDLRDAIDQAIAGGRAPSVRILKAANYVPLEICHRLIDPLTQGTLTTRVAAARTLGTIGVPADDTLTRAALERALRTLDAPDLRHAAADALNTPRAHDLARVPDLLSDLAADRPSARQLAARQIQSLGIFEPAVTTALIRATDAGDMITREGLRLALEQAFLNNRPTRDVLTDLASAAPTPNDPTRTYALRHLQAP